ncbi:hypothetical protein JM93_04059 [Roseibium hamelinense]|uniref:Uncharacterized protein n=1 Tax=Roseibium hamelinense TaxID=150831 RepID=A0A562SIN5_9HYPH|nr:hypothetical protein [Roseibium hamelinense]MTI43865.1 hypothetical protein [Roseibium hamelinense]TWI80844.1 hypothetical protein JM93_04059 [Roseibium hamelinense]
MLGSAGIPLEDGASEGALSGPSRGQVFWKLTALVVCAAFLGAPQVLADVTSTDLTDTTADMALPRQTDGQSAELLSAFFGLDNALPLLSRLICWGAPR